MTWKRARTEEQKDIRIAEIISATERLYSKLSFDEITFAAIAKEAKFTRSNLYKYFSSKEEIFLAFLERDVVQWRQELLVEFPSGYSCSIQQFAGSWVDIVVRQERLLGLIAILYTSLEKNIALERMVSFKRQATTEYATIVDLLCRLFPGLTSKQAVDFLQLQFAVAIGLYHMTDLSKLQQQVLNDPEFSQFKVDLVSSYREAVVHIISGLLN
jgi:AcrR family transcriptional regulator